MPYPSHVTLDQLLQTAEQLIEDQGVEKIALNDVALALGVKSPSLYRYVSSRADLLRRVNLRFLERLVRTVRDAADSEDSAEGRMLAVMVAYRQYAHAHPKLYLMSFTYMVDALRPDEDLLVQLVLPLQAAMSEVAGAEHSLASLRSVLAYTHGFVMLELNNQLRRGGDLSADFLDGALSLLSGWRTRI